MHEIKYICGDVAREFHADHHSRVKLLIGPFGTGKTSSAAYDQIMCQAKRVRAGKDGIKRSRFAVVRNTYPQLRDTTIKTIMEWFPPELFNGFYNVSEKKALYRIEDREIEVIFRALDIEKDVRNLLSLELTGAWCDEAREIRHEILKGLLGRVGRFPPTKDFDGQDPYLSPPQIALTTNYPSREHWLYKDFVEKPIEGYAIYEQTQEENKHNLRAGYYENLEKDYADRPDLLRTLVRGEWGVTVLGKQVYPEFDRRSHVANQELLPIVKEALRLGKNRIVRGWDHTGLSPACVITYLASSGMWMPFKEFCGSDIGIVDFGEMVKAWCAENLTGAEYVDIGDPAGRTRDAVKMSATDYLAQHCQINVQDGIQTFKVRRESIASRLNRRNGFMVDPSCIRLIDGFEGGYAYKEIGNTGIYRPEPDKNEYSHIHDALQYPATIMFGPVTSSHETSAEPEFAGDW